MRVLILLLILGLFGIANAQVVDRIVAVVNADVVTLSELQIATADALRQASTIESPLKRASVKKDILTKGLDALISERLVAQEAKKRQIVIREQDVSDRIEGMKNQQRWDDATFERYLVSQGMTRQALRSNIKKQLLNQRIVGLVLGSRVQVSESELQDYYREKKASMASVFELSAAHILLKLPTEPTVADESAVRHRANEIVGRLKAGESFDDLAKKYSEGPAAPRGGRLGMVRKGYLEPILEKAFFALEPNTYSQPVRSSFGYHVLTVFERRKIPLASFEQIAPQLTQELQKKRIDVELAQWVGTLKEKAFIDIRL